MEFSKSAEGTSDEHLGDHFWRGRTKSPLGYISFCCFCIRRRVSFNRLQRPWIELMRGGVMNHLKIGNLGSPLLRKGSADILLSLEKDEVYNPPFYFKPSLNDRDGGRCFINDPDPNYMSSVFV